MRRLTLTTLIAAAAVAAAGSASAQTMKAEIPFAFQAGGAVMGPGSYTVRIDRGSGAAHFTLRNLDTHRAVMVVQSVGSPAPRKWQADGRARLGFDCAGARRALREVWEGGDARNNRLSGPKFGPEAARSMEVVLTKAN